MQLNVIQLIARQFWRNAFKSKAIFPLIAVFAIMLAYAAYSGWKNYNIQNSIRTHHQKAVRESWENNPDKHPHRMAHYGSFAFRIKHKLSMFDFGLESYTGNAVFLEAHKQNTLNFSEASLSTGLLRFGEISMSMLLQVILPLILFFLGYSAIATERENGTLKVLLCQGADWKQLLIGKAVGLMAIAMIFFIPVALVTGFLLFVSGFNPVTSDELWRFVGTMIGYLMFFQVVSLISVAISATSSKAKEALVKLLAIWLVFVVLLPKTMQALGNYFYPSPSKIEFESIVEKDLIKKGDSHNPDDPHYKAIKDSLLFAYNVDSVHKLPFNYSGFIMQEGEKISASIYNQHLTGLFDIYKKQNELGRLTSFLNPYMAIRNISMALSGTDFESYIYFQKQAEEYRYSLAQEMNALQIKFISNKRLGEKDKPYSIGREHWKAFPDFKYRFLPIQSIWRSELLSIFSLIGWSIISILFVIKFSKKPKAI